MFKLNKPVLNEHSNIGRKISKDLKKLFKNKVVSFSTYNLQKNWYMDCVGVLHL